MKIIHNSILISSIVLANTICSFGQLTLSPNEVFAQCPSQSIQYTVTNSITPSCNYDWTVTKGSIQGGFQTGDESTFSGGNTVFITWFDVTTGGQIQVTARNCNNANGNSDLTKSIPILSINGVNPGAVTGDNNVTLNVTTNKVYSISQINFPNIGSGDVDPKQVNGYEWEIPSGWTVVSGGNTKSITVKPDDCSGGTIRVRGKNTVCAPNTFFTNWSTIKTITRTLATPGVISGPAFVLCSDTDPKNFSVSAVTGATSYSWTHPSGWVVSGASNNNSITLIPNGSNAGNVTVKANADNCSTQTPASLKTIPLNLTDPNTPPTISSSSLLICNGSNRVFTLSNVPPGATVTWAATPSFLFDTASGSGVTATLDAASNSSCCQGTLTYTIVTACGAAPPIQKNVQVGAPDVTFNIASYPFAEPECYDVWSINSFEAQQATGYPNTFSGYQWGWRNLTTNTSYTDPYGVSTYYTFIPEDAGEYEIWVRATNACGTSHLESVKNVTVGGCWGMFSIYPNPAGDYVEVEITTQSELKTNESMLYEAILFDSNGTEKLRISTKAEIRKIDTSSLKNGKYVLRIIYNGKITERQIMINR